ncbi:MAG: YjfB family protein [Propionivibrio sp.]
MAMSIGSVGTVPAALASAGTGDAVAVSVLKKSLDIQEQTALQLLQALPQSAGGASARPVGALGNTINTFA